MAQEALRRRQEKGQEVTRRRTITRTGTQRIRVRRLGGGTRTIPIRVKRTLTITSRRIRRP